MKFTAKTSNTTRLLFNDLGKDVKGVSPQEKFIALDAGDSVYLPDSSGVLYSAMEGDARRYEDNNLLDVNDIENLANAATYVVQHNFNYVPTVSVSKKVGSDWHQALVGTDYTAVTNAALTQTTITNVSGGTLDFYIRVS